MSEHLRIWRYHVKPEKRDAFVHHYASEGTWTQLFQRADGYLGTTLWQDSEDDNIFYTLDRWRSEADFAHFQAHFSAVYTKLDQQLQDISVKEELIGACNNFDAQAEQS